MEALEFRSEVRAWLAELASYAIALATTTLLFLVFQFMKWLGMDSDFIDLLDNIDKTATAIISGAAAISAVRRAVVRALTE